ncbi:MAG: low affinity iron permease family protein [Geminicoccaceae bacterium]
MAGIGDAFNRMAQWTARQAGKPATFALAVGLLVAWAASGPLFGWSDTWQLIVNTSTTIVTFLMVFLIQNTQNRDTAALQLKLDELIRAHEGARNRLLRLEELTEEEMEQVHERFLALARAAPRLTEERG